MWVSLIQWVEGLLRKIVVPWGRRKPASRLPPDLNCYSSPNCQPASLLCRVLNLPGSTTIMSQFLKFLIGGERKRNVLHTMTEWNLMPGFSNCKSWALYNSGDNTNSNDAVLFYTLLRAYPSVVCVCVYTCLASLWSTVHPPCPISVALVRPLSSPGLGESTCFKFVQLRQGIISITVIGLVKVSDKANQLKPSWISKENEISF